MTAFCFIEGVSLHILKIHLTASSLTTECIMCLRLWSLNQSGGVLSVHFPSQPEAVYHSQEDAEYKLINCHDWQCSLALPQCS